MLKIKLASFVIAGLFATSLLAQGRPFYLRNNWQCPALANFKTIRIDAPTRNPTRNLENIQRKIDRAVELLITNKARGIKVTFPKNKTYQIGRNLKRHDSLSIKGDPYLGIGCLIIEGNNSTLKVHNSNTGLYVGQCTNCAVKNLTITPMEQSSVSGVVKNINAAARTIDVQLYSQYKGLEINMAKSQNIIVGKKSMTVMFYEPRVNAGQHHVSHIRHIPAHTEVNRVTTIGPKRVRIFLKHEMIPASRLRKLAIGTLIAMRVPQFDGAKWNALGKRLTALKNDKRNFPAYLNSFYHIGAPTSAIYLEQNKNLKIDNVTLIDFPAMGIYMAQNYGRVFLNKIRMMREGKNGLMGNGSDGIHTNNNRVGAHVTNSHFEYLADDGINFAHAAAVAVKVVPGSNGRQVILAPFIRGTPTLKGDVYQMLEGKTGREMGTLKVVKFEVLSDKKHLITFNRPLPKNVRFAGAHNRTATRFINRNATDNNFLVKANTFISSVRNGVIARSTGRIINNKFSNLRETAVNLTIADMESSGATGIWGNHGIVHIVRNLVDDVDGGLIKTSSAPSSLVTKLRAVFVKKNKVTRSTGRVAAGDAVRRIHSSRNQLIIANTDSAKGLPKAYAKGFKIAKIPPSNVDRNARSHLKLNISSTANFRKIFKVPLGKN